MAEKNFIVLSDFMIAIRVISKGHNTMEKIKRASNINNVYAYGIKNEFIARGWINPGTNIVLTDKGKLISDAVEYMMQVLELDDEQIIIHRQKEKIKNEGTTIVQGSNITQEGGEQNELGQ